MRNPEEATMAEVERRCPECGSEVRHGSDSAPGAGLLAPATSRKAFCTSCGHPLTADLRFCTDCGTPVKGGADLVTPDRVAEPPVPSPPVVPESPELEPPVPTPSVVPESEALGSGGSRTQPVPPVPIAVPPAEVRESIENTTSRRTRRLSMVVVACSYSWPVLPLLVRCCCSETTAGQTRRPTLVKSMTPPEQAPSLPRRQLLLSPKRSRPSLTMSLD